MKEFTLRGDPKNTMNGTKVQCKIVAETKEQAFQVFAHIFPTARPCFCVSEREI